MKYKNRKLIDAAKNDITSVGTNKVFVEDFSREKKIVEETLKSSSQSSWGHLKEEEEEEKSNCSQVDPKDLEYFEKALRGEAPPSSIASKSESETVEDDPIIVHD